jgi:hypothetical protein
MDRSAARHRGDFDDDGAHRARAQGDDGAWLDGFDLEGGGPPRRYGAAELTTADRRAASSYGSGSYEQDECRAGAGGATPHDGEEDGKPAAAEVGYRSSDQGGLAGEEKDTDEGPYSENKRLLGVSHDTEVESLIASLRRTIEARRRLGVLDDENQKEELRRLWSDVGESLGMHRRDDDQQESRTEPTATASSGLPPADTGALNLSRQEHIEPSPGAYRVTPGRSVERASAVDSRSDGTNDESFQGDRVNFPPPPPLNQQTSDARTILIEADLVTEERELLSMLVEATPINRKRQIACILIAVLVVIAIIVGVVVGLLNRPPSSSTPAFAPLPVSLESILPSSTIERLEDTSSPQYLAFKWATEQDTVPVNDLPYDGQARLERMKQRFALATLFYATGGERSWEWKENWLNTTVAECYWTGIFCSTVHIEDAGSNTCRGSDRLVALSLSNNSLKQTFPVEIGLLTTLSSLNLDYNQLTGTIVTEIGQLTALTNLEIWNNEDLTGTLPTELGRLTGLTRLWMLSAKFSGPRLSGQLPSELGNLIALTNLIISGYQFSGTIPSKLGSLSLLDWLNLARNELTGTVPSVLGRLSKLGQLDVSFNTGLLGDIPSEVCTLVDRNTTTVLISCDDEDLSCACRCACA